MSHDNVSTSYENRYLLSQKTKLTKLTLNFDNCEKYRFSK